MKRSIVFLLIQSTLQVACAISCEEGWETSGTTCYLFVQDTPAHVFAASENCNQRDAVLAYPTTQDELVYLTNAVKKRHVYGWWLGYSTTNTGKSMFPNKRAIWDYEPLRKTSVPKIPMSQTSDVSQCWSMFLGGENTPEFAPEPCEVTMPFVCTGDPQKTKNDNYSKRGWSITVGMTIYVSEDNHLVSYNDAKKECQALGMNLMKLTEDAKPQIMKMVEERRYSIGVWWTGLVRKDDNTLQWSDQSKVDSSVDLQSQFMADRMYFYMLKGSGLMRSDKESWYRSRPFICQKSALDADTNFGCPGAWFRGGQSCYHRTWQTKLSQSDAANKCKEQGAHLLTVDSLDEKRFLESSSMLSGYRDGQWTSLNDIKNEGVFVWGDSTPLDTKLVRWLGSYGEGDRSSRVQIQLAMKGQLCGLFDPGTGALYGDYCNSPHLTGCQYKLPEGTTTCFDGWALFDGRCYYTKTQTLQKPFYSNLAVCDSLLSNADRDIKANFIQVYSKEQVNFLSRTFTKKVWLGLTTQFTPPHFLNVDASEPNLELFNNMQEPNNGLGKGEQDCVQIFYGGGYTDENCDDKAAYICEKEISLDVRSLRVRGTGAVNKFCAFITYTLILGGWLLAE